MASHQSHENVKVRLVTPLALPYQKCNMTKISKDHAIDGQVTSR